MGIDNSHRLQVRINDDGPHELHAPALQVLGNGIRQLRADLACLINHLPFCPVPEIAVKAPPLLIVVTDVKGIPGVGIVLAATILSEIGDISRFSSADKLLAYAGLDPTVRQSGEFESSQNRMSKRGSPYLHRAIWLASTSAVQYDPMFQTYYEKEKLKGLHYMNVSGVHVLYCEGRCPLDERFTCQ